MSLFFVTDFLAEFFFERLKQIKRDVCRLKLLRIGVRYVVHQRAKRATARRGCRFFAACESSRIDPGKHSRRDGFGVTLDSAKLPGEHEGRQLFRPCSKGRFMDGALKIL